MPSPSTREYHQSTIRVKWVTYAQENVTRNLHKFKNLMQVHASFSYQTLLKHNQSIKWHNVHVVAFVDKLSKNMLIKEMPLSVLALPVQWRWWWCSVNRSYVSGLTSKVSLTTCSTARTWWSRSDFSVYLTRSGSRKTASLAVQIHRFLQITCHCL